jgi:peptide/nickel transport system ATP-binding protein
MGVVSAVADDVLVMKDGIVVEQGPVGRVLRAPQHVYTQTLLAALPSIRAGRASRGPVTLKAEQAPVALSAEGLTKYYPRPGGGPVTVVQDVSLELRQGRTLGLVGESGAGKSTLARMLLGLTEPDRGTVSLFGQPWSGVAEAARRPRRPTLQMVYQDPLSSFDPRLTVVQILLDALRAAGLRDRRKARDRAADLLAQVGLADRLLSHSPRILSGGQRQRVAIARAIATEPAILICDEPVSALDLLTQAQILDLLADLRTRLGISMIFISHDLDVIRQVSDDIMVLRDGCVVESGPAEAIATNPQHAYTRRLFDATLRVRSAA